MPLVRADGPNTATPAPALSREAALTRLTDPDAQIRRAAARELAGDAASAPALAAQLACEPVHSVRDALFASLVSIGGGTTAALIAPLLKRDDAGLRGGALEALKLLDADSTESLDMLLADPDADVRVLAIEVMRGWPSARAVPRLSRLIESDPHVNVCGAAVDVATEVGTRDLLVPLARLRDRFPLEGFLAFAIDTACARVGGKAG